MTDYCLFPIQLKFFLERFPSIRYVYLSPRCFQNIFSKLFFTSPTLWNNFNVHGTVYRYIVFYITNEMQLIQCFYCYLHSTCFGRFFRPSSGVYKTVCAPWVLSCFPDVYRWCGWVGTQFYMLLMMGRKNGPKHVQR